MDHADTREDPQFSVAHVLETAGITLKDMVGPDPDTAVLLELLGGRDYCLGAMARVEFLEHPRRCT
jgi:hypothetical protein